MAQPVGIQCILVCYKTNLLFFNSRLNNFAVITILEFVLTGVFHGPFINLCFFSHLYKLAMLP